MIRRVSMRSCNGNETKCTEVKSVQWYVKETDCSTNVDRLSRQLFIEHTNCRTIGLVRTLESFDVVIRCSVFFFFVRSP